MGKCNFKVGDRVKFIKSDTVGGDAALLIGDIGTVSWAGDDIPKVTWDEPMGGNGENGNQWFMRQEQLELIVEPIKQIAVPAGLKVGDRVRYVGDATYGEIQTNPPTTGTVVEATYPDEVCVEFDGWFGGHGGPTGKGMACWYFGPTEAAGRIEKIEEPKEETKMATTFKVGDNVRYVGGATYGEIKNDPPTTGTVVEMLSSGGIQVEFNGWHRGHAGFAGDGSRSRWNFWSEEGEGRLELIQKSSFTKGQKLICPYKAWDSEFPCEFISEDKGRITAKFDISKWGF